MRGRTVVQGGFVDRDAEQRFRAIAERAGFSAAELLIRSWVLPTDG